MPSSTPQAVKRSVDNNFQMKRLLPLLLLLAGCAARPTEQPAFCSDPVLARQLVESGFLHSPLPLDKAHSAEAWDLAKAVLAEEVLPLRAADWSVEGPASLQLTAEGVVLAHPNFTGKRAVGPEGDRDYATYGTARAVCSLAGRNLQAYNRIYLQVYPDCDGGRVCCLNLSFDGHEAHLMHFENRQWNEACLDLGDWDRTAVRAFSLHTTLKGKDGVTGDSSRFLIRDIRFQQVENPERRSGWEPMEGRIILSQSGYWADGEKTAIISGSEAENQPVFRIETAAGRTVFKGRVQPAVTTIGRYGVLDFSDFRTEGNYTLRVGEHLSAPLRIAAHPFDNAAWRVLNGLFGQRCGYSVPGVHTACHRDLLAVHDGRFLSYGGGWHDAGDLSQQTLQSGEVTFALLETYAAVRATQPVFAARVLEEARWGLEFLLQTRFGDGWRASSMGLLHWTDGVLGTLDDIVSVRTQQMAFDNYLLAAVEAYAARVLPDDDPAFKERLAVVAEEDFAFAQARFAQTGFEPFPFIMEHTYNTSRSQYMATVAWSAAQLYLLTGKESYADCAAQAIAYTLDCQQTEALADGTAGFFWRDTTRTGIVHFIHQSREQVFMQACTLLCETFPTHPDRPRWENAIRLYAGYLKQLRRYTAPYGMIPSGVYARDEYRDTAGFAALHIFAPADAPARFTRQVEGGIPIDGHFFIKRFPVWFTIFNGNNAILLASGKAAVLCGKHLSDPELCQLGAEQLYWTVGKNPFGQSLIYGEGRLYPQMSSFSSGELTGEMPVGIRSAGDADVPEWPAVNNACYKEVWTTVAGKWFSLLSELFSED